MKKIILFGIVLMLLTVAFSGCVDDTNVAPTAAIFAESTIGTAPFTANFEGAADDTDGTIVSFEWTLDGAKISSIQNPSYIFEIPGTYVVTLIVTDDDGATGTDEITIIAESGETQLKPYFITPLDGDLVYEDTNFWISESAGNDAILSEFYYSTDGLDWTLIASDDDGSEKSISGEDVEVMGSGDGWSCTWDISNLEENWYYIRAKMYSTDDETGQSDILLYVDSTPPVPTILTPTNDETVQGEVFIDVLNSDEDIENIYLEILTAENYYEKGVELKDQHHYCHNMSGKNLSTVCCGPTAAASCLKYWADNGFPDIMKNPTNGADITQTQLVEKLAELMKTNETGTCDSDFIKGIRDYLDSVGLGSTNENGLIVRVETNDSKITFKRYKDELEAYKEDVLWGVVWNWDATNNRWNNGHWLVGNSVNDTLTNDTDGDGLKEHKADFMNPSGYIMNVTMNTDGTFIHPRLNKWIYPDTLVTVSEKISVELGWLELGDPYETDDGWTYAWDTTSVSNGFYFIRATLYDSDGWMGNDMVLVKVENEVATNQEPTIEDVLYEQLHENYEDSPHRYTLTAYASDPDENLPLTYEWSINCGYFEGDVNSSSVEWRYDTPGECIDAEVTVTVIDSQGATDSFTKQLF